MYAAVYTLNGMDEVAAGKVLMDNQYSGICEEEVQTIDTDVRHVINGHFIAGTWFQDGSQT